METLNLPVKSDRHLNVSKTGKRYLKYRHIAELVARGWTAASISHEIKMDIRSVYKVLKSPQVCELVNELVTEKFKEGDQLMGFLYKKALKQLDEDISSKNPDVRLDAIEKVLKCYGYGKSRGDGVNILQQFQGNFQFNAEGGTQNIQDIDAWIIQKRKERGLSLNKNEDE